MQKKTALVTGASHGIGRQIALTLAENGYDLGINYFKSNDSIQEVCALVEKRGAKALCLQADVGKINEIDRMFEFFFREFLKIDLLVNNAGISKFAPFLQVTEELWNEITNTDWKGSYFCAQRAGKNMVENHTKGVIINISSNHVDGCWPNANIYGPTKAALSKFTKNIAMELAQYGIRVVAVAPGYTDIGWDSSDPIYRATERLPLKRFATTKEIADAVVFLASDKAQYITGTCLTIDGGALLPVLPENTII
jgi:NAD(P)-dependent dehydrogenase (short-subunit alcohol dehydrogenase family)